MTAGEARVANYSWERCARETADVYRDPARLRQTVADLEATKDGLARLYQHWEEAVELDG